MNIEELNNIFRTGYEDNETLIAIALVTIANQQKEFNDAMLKKLEFLNVINDWGELQITVVDRSN